MKALPNGWVEAAIDDLRSSKPHSITDGPYGSNLKSSHYTASGPIVVRLGNIGSRRYIDDDRAHISPVHFASLQKHHVLAGDIVVAALGDPIGRACLVPDYINPALVKADCFRFRPAQELDVSYLMLWLNSDDAKIKFGNASHGLGRIRINLADFRSIHVPVAPASEQRRIVAKIDRSFAKSKRARDHLHHIPRLVEKYKQAILTIAFRGELTRDWRIMRSASTEPWPECSLAEIADIGTGSTPKRGEPRYYSEGHIAWITSGAVNTPLVQRAEEFITEAAVRETNCKIFPAGTLLMAMYGEGQTRGKVAVLGIDAATNQALAAIQIRSTGQVGRDFVLWYLRTNYLELRRKAAGGVQPNLNLGIIKALQIPLPSRSEQDEIVRRIETAFAWIDRLVSEATGARKLIDRLDQAVLAKAFRGELVPQDPNDEPASVLLERICSQRVAAPRIKTKLRTKPKKTSIRSAR